MTRRAGFKPTYQIIDGLLVLYADGGFDAGARERQFAQPMARRVRQRIRDCGCSRPLARLTGAQEGLPRPVDDVHLDFAEAIGKAQDRIAAPIAAQNAGVIERDGFVKRPARRLDYASRDLQLDAVRADGLSAVG